MEDVVTSRIKFGKNEMASCVLENSEKENGGRILGRQISGVTGGDVWIGEGNVCWRRASWKNDSCHMNRGERTQM